MNTRTLLFKEVNYLTRKYVVTPRVGVVKFRQARKAKLMKFSVVMLIVNVVALILGFVAAMNSGIMILVGLAVFVRLLHDNPVPTEGIPSGEA